jgi:hypothetical protein
VVDDCHARTEFRHFAADRLCGAKLADALLGGVTEPPRQSRVIPFFDLEGTLFYVSDQEVTAAKWAIDFNDAM